ncbi:TetR/AcrR family transcriptional regulator [Lutimaribacter marinistellae]|uniref:TetR/AcrR family transcriptional regulator n=1 Tax=Lutimaribacter marinistellae TaxID=1820329 RepID=A0ABV7THB7_9RHOB
MTQTATATRTDRYDELLDAAAECFRTRGFSATSIDTVARHLGATKGRVYHYFPSKMDLFDAVRDRAMDIVFEAIEPGRAASGTAAQRMAEMARGHARAMFHHHPYMQVLMDGLQMHRYSTTTDFQRETLARHLQRRDAYEKLFHDVIEQGLADGSFTTGESLALTIQTFFSALNGPVFWYRARPDDSPAKLDRLAEDVVRFALRGLGVTQMPTPAPRSKETA